MALPTTPANANTTPPNDSTSPSMATEVQHTAPPTSNPRKVPDNPTTDAQNHTITIASLNIQNIKSNKPYLQELLKQHDIVCIQEHWLFNYEQNWVKNNFSDISVNIKSVDDEEPISHAQKIRGYGGIAILGSNPTINDNLKQLPDGNARIQAVELKTKNTKMVIINAYMPCRNSRTGSADFAETLDVIREITSKYRNTHSIVLLGDFNSSLSRTPENQQDRKLKDFLKDQWHTDRYRAIPTRSTNFLPPQRKRQCPDRLYLPHSIIPEAKRNNLQTNENTHYASAEHLRPHSNIYKPHLRRKHDSNSMCERQRSTGGSRKNLSKASMDENVTNMPTKLLSRKWSSRQI